MRAVACVVAVAALSVPAGAPTTAVSADTRATAQPRTFPGSNGRFVFTRERPAGDHTQTDLLSGTSDATDVVRLTATPGRNEFGPAWGPRGMRIAFWRTRAPFGPGSLWVMAADGSTARRLTHGVDARDPSWNPAGTRLVYTAAAPGDIYTLRVSDGGERRRLTSGPALDFEPAWSPDGTRIAFTRSRPTGDPGDIFVITLATGQLVRVTDSPAYDHQVGWAPDGHHLVFERDWSTSSSIFTVRPNGTGVTRLTRGRHFDTSPTCSPDGRWIGFASDRGGVMSDLWVMRRNGADPRLVRHGTYPVGEPDWQALPTH
jgi:Tol biopolymer transport system component